MSDEQAAENAWKQASEQSRKDTPAQSETDDDTPTLEDAIADAYAAIDAGDVSSNLTLRDENLAALFHGLEEADRLVDVGEGAADQLDRDDEDTETRAAVLRLLVRIGLAEVDKSVIESGKAGRQQYLDTDAF